MRTWPILLLFMLLAPGAYAWEQCSYEVSSSDSVKLGQAQLMEIEALAGFLKVTGVSGSNEILVEATACATNEKLLEDVEWSLARQDRRIRLTTDLPGQDNDEYVVLNLTVTVPAGLDMDINDTSGSLTVAQVGALRVRDSSGSIDIDGVGGSLIVDDSSGSITIENVSGNVQIDDGSGSIDVEQVAGSVVINDGSGSIDIDDVKGSVDIEDDGSGGISVADVGGDFIVRNDGSGGISHRRVQGQVRIPD